MLGVLKTWIGGQRGQHMEPTTREDSPLHAFLMHFPASLCSCREQFHIYKVYSHFAIAFLTVLAPRVRRDQYIQYALFHRLNFFFFPKEWMSSFFTPWTPYLKVHFAEAGNIKSPQGQNKAQILRDHLENIMTFIVQYSVLNPAYISFRSHPWLWAERCWDLVPLLFLPASGAM